MSLRIEEIENGYLIIIQPQSLDCGRVRRLCFGNLSSALTFVSKHFGGEDKREKEKVL
jgi:hypothetical protein